MCASTVRAQSFDVLETWLAPMELADFVTAHLGRRPHARAGTAANALPLLRWETLDAVLGSPQPIDLMTVARGRLVEAPRPTCLADVRRLMQLGVSTVVRASERHDPGLAALARAFCRALPGEVHIQLYATPAGTYSYGWHYDFEDVFIAQTGGIKDYFFRKNTVAGDARLGQPLDFTSFREETTPVFSSRLEPGDWLYIPARWWHLVTCVAPSLSISIGVMSPEEFRNAERLPAGWSGTTAQPTEPMR